jgi:hypothetical protein
MLSQFKTILDSVKNDMSIGASNTTEASKQTRATVAFSRELYKEIREKTLLPYVDLFYSKAEADIIENLIFAILAQAFRCGRCCEYAALVFMKLLEAEIDLPIDIVNLRGKSTSTGFFIRNDEKKIYRYEDHSIVAVNRDAKMSLFYDISTWQNVTILDAWRKGQLKEYKGDETPIANDLTYDFIDVTSFQLISHAEGNLEAEQWNRLVTYLVTLKTFINAYYSEYSDRFNVVIDRKIEQYQNLAKPVAERNGKNYLVTLFKPDSTPVRQTTTATSTTPSCCVVA